MANDGKPQEDKLVSQLIPDPAQGPPDATTLTGYLGRAPEPKEKGKGASWRLYQSPSLDCYVEIAEESILHTQKLPDDRGTIVWVPKSLQLRYVQVHSTQVQAEMLGSGSIAQGGMAGSPNLGPEGELGTSVATVCSTVTCPTLGLCLSQTTCPTMNIVCVTHTGPCLSAALSYCTICPPPSATPSHCTHCPPLSAVPSHCTHCPPPPLLSATPSHCTHCPPLSTTPSHCTLCPTPTATGGRETIERSFYFNACPPPHSYFGCPSATPIGCRSILDPCLKIGGLQPDA